MCTLTLVPLPGRVIRLAFNRDEQRSRPAALPPQRRRFGPHDAILPIDPPLGTWLAVNDAGLALALLNVNPPGSDSARRPERSRGEIIPDLLPCGSLDELLDRARELPASDFAPFRLLAVSEGVFAEVISKGHGVRLERRAVIAAPQLFTSSGLGDHLVEAPRRRLFTEMFAIGDWPTQQAAFHRHRWPGREALSVCMSRPEARTVSHVVVDLRETDVVMTYLPDSPDRPTNASMAHIVFQPVPVR
jgi:Transport and Golgi organisation 2